VEREITVMGLTKRRADYFQTTNPNSNEIRMEWAANAW
jgi:hypothetical protein